MAEEKRMSMKIFKKKFQRQVGVCVCVDTRQKEYHYVFYFIYFFVWSHVFNLVRTGADGWVGVHDDGIDTACIRLTPVMSDGSIDITTS